MSDPAHILDYELRAHGSHAHIDWLSIFFWFMLCAPFALLAILYSVGNWLAERA